MKFIYDLKIGPKLNVVLAVTMLFLVAMVMVSVSSTQRLANSVDQTASIEAGSQAVRAMQSSVFREVIAMRGFIISGEARALADLSPAREDYRKALEAARAEMPEPEFVSRLARIDEARQQVEAKLDEKRSLREHGDMAAIVKIEQTVMPELFRAFNEPVSELIELSKLESQRAVTGSRDFAHQMALTLLIAGLACMAISFTLATLISRSITTPLKRVIALTQKMAVGELPGHIEKAYNDCVGDLVDALNVMVGYLKEVSGVAEAMSQGDLTRTVAPKSPQDTFGRAIAQMVTNLRGITQQVRQSAEAVGESSQQIASSSNELSRTVSVQASSAEETSATMEEMAANLHSVDQNAQSLGHKVTTLRGQADELAAAVTQTSSSISELAASVQQVAGNVGHANQMADEASQAANAGEKAVSQTIAGMQAINDTMQGIRSTIQVLDQRSAEIGAIIEVIDDIAEQTNLLALNAAIEAARAGEAGRGFAVVADEVRKLAERSAKATGEIGALIKGIQKETAQAVGVTEEGAAKVQEGSQLASSTGEVLVRIKEASMRVGTLLSEVAAATSEQARASQQIVTATEQMAAINQQVTAAVGEMSDLTRSVTYATAEQRQGSDQVVFAVESLNKSSQEAAAATSQVSRTADVLADQATSLQEAVGFFKLEEAGRLELKVAARSPLALPVRV